MQIFDFETLNQEWAKAASKESIEGMLPEEARADPIGPVRHFYKGEIIFLGSLTKTGPFGQCLTFYVIAGKTPTVIEVARLQGIHPLILFVTRALVEPVEIDGEHLLKVTVGAPHTFGSLGRDAPPVYFRVR